jgi:hypothetical protein
MKGYAYYRGTKNKKIALKTVIEGTVLSGNATATTLGNTLRVITYL